VAGTALGIVLVIALSAFLVPFRADITRATPALVLVIAVVAAGLVGGRVASVITAAVAALAFNLAFIPPYWTLTITVVDDVVAFAVFTVVGLAGSPSIARSSSRRSTSATRTYGPNGSCWPRKRRVSRSSNRSTSSARLCCVRCRTICGRRCR